MNMESQTWKREGKDVIRTTVTKSGRKYSKKMTYTQAVRNISNSFGYRKDIYDGETIGWWV